MKAWVYGSPMRGGAEFVKSMRKPMGLTPQDQKFFDRFVTGEERVAMMRQRARIKAMSQNRDALGRFVA